MTKYLHQRELQVVKVNPYLKSEKMVLFATAQEENYLSHLNSVNGIGKHMSSRLFSPVIIIFVKSVLIL